MPKKEITTQTPELPTVVIDATNQVMGRLASEIAKRLLGGEKIIVVNAEKAVITGNKKWIVKDYKNKLQIKTASNPRRGPFQPRMPDRILRRTVRGMLPMKKTKGRNAYRRLRTYIGVPEEYENTEKIRFDNADVSRLKSRYITLAELSRELGWHDYIYA